jgi:Holliday junction resolvase RusA-like endonuclease
MNWSGSIIVWGPAATQGSKRAFINKRTGHPIIVEDNKNLMPWRTQAVAEMRECKPEVPFDEAMLCRVTVYVHRPAAHFRTNGELKPSAPTYPKVGKDQDKILRACFDAMKIGGWVKDDARFADAYVRRRYDEEERVVIECCPLDADIAGATEEQVALFNLKGEGPKKAPAPEWDREKPF